MMTLGQCAPCGCHQHLEEGHFSAVGTTQVLQPVSLATPCAKGKTAAGCPVMIKSVKYAGRGECHPQLRTMVLEDVTAIQMTPGERHGYAFVGCRHRTPMNRVQHPIKLKGD